MIPETAIGFAFVVSRHAGNAPVRNRVKRRLREAVRLHREVWPSGGMAVIFRADTPRPAQVKFAELEGEVCRVLSSIPRRESDRKSGR
jgi:ribonuclease P protein component